MTRIAGIVLCGGQSRRMGRPKADLPFSGDSLLVNAARLVNQVADPVVVAAAPNQNLPAFPENVRIVHDSKPAQGPLAAFVDAGAHIPPDRDWTYLVSCDLPFLTIPFLNLLAARAREADAVVPFVDDKWHPLAALYRRPTIATAGRVFAAGARRMLDLLDALNVSRITADDLLQIDPFLRVLRNVNTPEDYAAALRELESPGRLSPP
jgi:molybdopterin-guanine dinucleotide biosynthesis protein A